MGKTIDELDTQNMSLDECIAFYRGEMAQDKSSSELVDKQDHLSFRKQIENIMNSYALFIALFMCLLIFVVVFKFTIKRILINMSNFAQKKETDIYLAHALTSLFSFGITSLSFVLMLCPFAHGFIDGRLLFIATILGCISVLTGFVWNSLILSIKKERAINIKERNLEKIGPIFKDTHPAS